MSASAIIDFSLLLLVSPLLLTLLVLAFILRVIEIAFLPILHFVTYLKSLTGCAFRPKSPVTLQQSIEPWFLFTLRVLMRLLPIWPLRKITYFFRSLFKFFHRSGKFAILNKFHHIDQISYRVDNDVISSNNSFLLIDDPTFLIIIHGGGFSLCDNGDIGVLDRLFPQLEKELGGTGSRVPYVFSITYDTVKINTNDNYTLFEEVQGQILTAYDNIKHFASGKRLVGMIGDSAGGNLVLSLVMKLQDRGDDLSGIRLCLTSPWVDLYSKTIAYEENRKTDMLTAEWLARSRAHYAGAKMDAALLPTMISHQLRTLGRELTRELLLSGTQVVIFDMDQCLVNAHSRGQLKRTALPAFIAKVKHDFIVAAFELHRAGLCLAVATHSDAQEYIVNKRNEVEYIMGEELVWAVLQAVVPQLAAEFRVVAYNPRVRSNTDPQDAHKRRHVREIAEQLGGISQAKCVLFDDDPGNVQDTGGLFTAYKVNECTGFDLVQAVLAVRATTVPAVLARQLLYPVFCLCGCTDAVDITRMNCFEIDLPATSFHHK